MKIDSAGQLTIPAELQEKFGFKPGTEVAIQAQGEALLVSKVFTLSGEERRKQLEAWILKNRGRTQGRMSTDEILRMTRGED